MTETLAGKDDLILVLNSGSSSLKFGVYYRGANDEEPLLTGTPTVWTQPGLISIHSPDGKLLVRRDNIVESQQDALAALAAAVREHMQSSPRAVAIAACTGDQRSEPTNGLPRRSWSNCARPRIRALHVPGAVADCLRTIHISVGGAVRLS